MSLSFIGLPEGFPAPKGHVNRPRGTVNELKSGNGSRLSVISQGYQDLVGRGARKSCQSLPQRADDKGAPEAIWSSLCCVNKETGLLSKPPSGLLALMAELFP